MTRMIFYLITALLSVATLSACGIPLHGPEVSPEPVKVEKSPEVSPEPAKVEKAPPQQPDPTDLKNQQARKQARHLLDEQEYAAAVNFIHDEVRKGAEEQAVAEEYQQAANTCLKHADNLMKIGDYSGAARLFKTVRDDYPKSPAVQQRVTLTRTQIAAQLDTCAEKLMKAGLIAYRAGEFTKGIDFWQRILVFNPQHQAALGAIKTTRQQISRLEALMDKE